MNFIRSSVIGTLIGIIPATGVSAASFLAYSEAKRFSRRRKCTARAVWRASPQRDPPTTRYAGALILS
ncbi:MAG: tripartite tricarboxylate transporter permease [Bilophila wadsworthia]